MHQEKGIVRYKMQRQLPQAVRFFKLDFFPHIYPDPYVMSPSVDRVNFQQ